MPVRRFPYELFWDRFAKLYSPVQEKSNVKLYDDVSVFISKHLCKNDKVLEIACGTGQITKRCCGSAGEWEATDFSEKMKSLPICFRVIAGRYLIGLREPNR